MVLFCTFLFSNLKTGHFLNLNFLAPAELIKFNGNMFLSLKFVHKDPLAREIRPSPTEFRVQKTACVELILRYEIGLFNSEHSLAGAQRLQFKAPKDL